MKHLIRLNISLALICYASAFVVQNSMKSQEQKEHSLSAFLKTQLLNLRNHETLLTSIPVQDLDLSANETSLMYLLSTRSVGVHNFGSYAVSNVATDLAEGTIHFQLDVLNLEMSGNYSLDGLVSSVILLKGEGLVNITSHSVTTIGKGDIVFDGSGIGSINNLHFVSIGSTVHADFQGIQSEEVIGELIKEDLKRIGSAVFDATLEDLHTEVKSIIADHVNKALADLPIEEIGQIVVIDTFLDEDVTGWYVDDADCKYSDTADFYCDGFRNLSINLDSRGSNGFWAACPTEYDWGNLCTFHYRPEANERLHRIQIDGYYSQNPLAYSSLEISYENSSSYDVQPVGESGIVELHADRRMLGMTLYVNHKSDQSDYIVIDKVTLYTSRV